MAIVATGENFPDALAASALAGDNAPAPIVLTETASLSSEAVAALDELGVTDVTVVGGTEAVSPAVVNSLQTEGYTVTRVAGTTRYGTAADIATTVGTAANLNGLPTAIIATGENFPDALAGGPMAYEGHPLLLVNSGGVPAETEAALESLGVEQVVLLGGTAVISAATETALEGIVGNDAIRHAGVNRFGTAQAVGEALIADFGYAPETVLLASGVKFPDALVAGPLGGELNAPIILTSSLPAESEEFLDDHSDTITDIIAIGGTAVIDDATLAAAEAAAENVANDQVQGTSVSTRPELQSATIRSTNTTDGTTVGYCFDEPVTWTTATSFHLFTAAGGGSINATTAVNDLSNNMCVNAIFPALTTAASVAGLTLATVDDAPAAVTDNSSPAQTNPIGDVPLGTGGSTSFAAGVTASPDLTAVGSFTPDPVMAGQTQVTFTFDEAAYNTGTNGYRLLRTDGATVISCTYVSGTGTTSILVRCPTGAPAPSASTIARGYVEAGTVTDSPTAAGPNLNPLHAADIAASAGPDLVSATLQADATQGVTQVDRVIYTFDEAIQTAVTTTNFQAYLAGGTEVSCGSVACTNVLRNEANQTQVSVDFPNNSLSSAVGASVLASAVTGFTSTLANQPDEVGMANAGTATVTPGETAGPDLTGVVISATKDPFGNVTGASTVFTFDEDITLGSTPTAGAFKIYLPSGTGDVFTCTATAPVSNTAPLTQRMVVCGAWDTAPTIAQFQAMVLGTVEQGAVAADDGGVSNPDGASTITKVGF